MGDTDEIVVEGATVEEAVRQGLELLDASPADVQVIVEQPPSRGLLGLGQRPARVRLIRLRPAQHAIDSILESVATGCPAGSAPSPNPPGQDGTVAIQQGRVTVTPPQGLGRWPVIRPGAHAVVMVNGVAVERPRVVQETDRIEVRAVDEPPVAEVRVEVSADGLKAVLFVERRPGRRYTIPDHPAAVELTVTASPAETIPPPPVTAEQIRAALASAGVVSGIDEAAIERVLTDQASGPVVVATGQPPQPPVDGRVDLYFPNEPLVKRDPGEEEKQVDLLALYQVPSVRPGDLLAVKIPPREGQAGRTVTGKPIPVPKAKDTPLRAGPGAMVDSTGLRVYAERGGRPTFLRGVVSVVPEHVVHGDVDPNTGHVEFDGDVIVRGSVNERMRVVASGKVVVAGVVSGAYVQGDQGVLVGRSIVRSRVVAGGFSQFGELVTALQLTQQDISRLVEAVRAVKSHRQFLTADLQQRGDGPLVKLLIERKFPGLPERIGTLLRLTRTLQRAPASDLEEFARTCHRFLVGLGPLELRSTDQLTPLAEQARRLVHRLQEEQARPADVVARYIQNSQVEASGQIRMPGGTCFYARLFAGKGVIVRPGVFRGDQITVQEGDVLLDEVGSPSGARTQIEILTSGRFSARLVHPNVRVTIGGQSHLFDRAARAVEVRPGSRGELEILQAT